MKLQAAHRQRLRALEGETDMAEPASHDIFTLVDEPAPAPAERRLTGAGAAREVHEFPSRGSEDDEVGYCLARAAAEARWAGEAAHPAARRAHLELVAIYRRRALEARQGQSVEVQDWLSEGGRVPPNV